jgi:CHAT domain-containing protein
MASLWAVEDRATGELMKRFYEGMLGERKLRPADALRQAQIAMWRKAEWRSPYYWGAFTIQGEWK